MSTKSQRLGLYTKHASLFDTSRWVCGGGEVTHTTREIRVIARSITSTISNIYHFKCIVKCYTKTKTKLFDVERAISEPILV